MPDQTPVYLEVEPNIDAKHLDCFLNVERKIEKDGGIIQYGWRIWERPQIMLEAVFHAVWVSPQNRLVEITPNPINAQKILFLPDTTKVYEGKQINNIRYPLRNNPLIQEYIEINNKIFAELNKGDLAYYHGNVELSADLVRRKIELEMELQKLELLH